MATKRVLPDKDFDRIIVRTHKLARNVTMRVKPDGLHVTFPPYSLSSKVLEVVEQYRQRLLEDWRKVSKKPIDLNFRIHTPPVSVYGWSKVTLLAFPYVLPRRESRLSVRGMWIFLYLKYKGWYVMPSSVP